MADNRDRSDWNEDPRNALAQARKELESLRRWTHFLQAILDGLPNPIFAKNEELRFCLVNKAFESFFGVRREDILGKTVMDVKALPPGERERYATEDAALICTGDTAHYETEFETGEGRRYVLYWSKGVLSENFGDRGLVGAIVDISYQQHISMTDLLTNLPNRRCFEERLEEIHALSERHGDVFCLIMADLDHFKTVNDTYGHGEGDVTLRKAAEVLASHCRHADIAARFGGEEFMLLLPKTDMREACLVAERICAAFREHIRLPDGSPVTVSLGVAEYRRGESAQDMVRRTDAALYRAKGGGRDRFAC